LPGQQAAYCRSRSRKPGAALPELLLQLLLASMLLLADALQLTIQHKTMLLLLLLLLLVLLT
jgi:hypothetical protein